MKVSVCEAKEQRAFNLKNNKMCQSSNQPRFYTFLKTLRFSENHTLKKEKIYRSPSLHVEGLMQLGLLALKPSLIL